MSTRPTDSVLLALHYQNENCHPEGKIKVGIAEREQAWRAEMHLPRGSGWGAPRCAGDRTGDLRGQQSHSRGVR
jgi:hypothetical protein